MPSPEPPPAFLFCFIGFFVLVVVMIVIRVARRSEASGDYKRSLEILRQNPGNPALRDAAIRAGREYSRMTRNQYGIPWVSEASIKDDVDAIASPLPQVTAPVGPTVADRLRTLDELWNQGLINEAEYHERRAAILADV